MIPSTCMTHAHCCVALGLEFKLPIRSLGKIIQQFVKRIARVTSILYEIKFLEFSEIEAGSWSRSDIYLRKHEMMEKKV